MKKPNQAIELTFNAAFKMYFKREPELLKFLLKYFLPLPKDSVVADIELLDTEFTRNAFTMKIKTEDGRDISTQIVILEMHSNSLGTLPHPTISDRLLANACLIYSKQFEQDEYCDKVSTIYSLAFVPHLKSFESIQNDYYHVYNLRYGPSLNLAIKPKIEFIVVELDKFLTPIDKLLDLQEALCYLLKRGHQMNVREFDILRKKGEIMEKAVKHLWSLSENEFARKSLILEKQYQEQNFREEYAVKKIALNLLRTGTNIKTICQCTGLTEQEVQGLQRKQQ